MMRSAVEPAAASGKRSSRSGERAATKVDPTNYAWASAASMTLSTLYTVYVLSAFLIRNVRKTDTLNLVWKITKWPAFVSVFAQPVWSFMSDGKVGPWDVILFAINAYSWWFWKDSGDDDWTKKLKDRAAGVVQSIGHRLVVVPAHA